MAVLSGPLFSLGARQQIGKTLVYFTWKGLNVVRQLVVPTNPNTSAQQTHRGYLTACVAKIHLIQVTAVALLGIVDKTAYSLYGSTFPTPRTWFNTIVKNWIDCNVAAKKASIFTGGAVNNPIHTDFRPVIYLNEEGPGNMANAKFYVGTSKTAVIANKAAVLIAGVQATLPPGGGIVLPSAGVKYYWWITADTGDTYEGAHSGIYHWVST